MWLDVGDIPAYFEIRRIEVEGNGARQACTAARGFEGLRLAHALVLAGPLESGDLGAVVTGSDPHLALRLDPDLRQLASARIVVELRYLPFVSFPGGPGAA